MESATQNAEVKPAQKRPYEKPRVAVIAVEAYDVLGTCTLDVVGTCLPTTQL
jgi:hypothetical protein